MRTGRILVVTVLIAVGASACGSSSKAGSSTPTTASSPSRVNGSFCDLMRKDKAAFTGVEAAASTPAQLKEIYGTFGTAFDEARSAAPIAIRSDFTTFVTAFETFRSALVVVNYTPSKLSPRAVLQLEAPNLKAAVTRVGNYLERVCKIKLTPAS